MKFRKKYLLIFIITVFLLILGGIRFRSYFSTAIPLWYDHWIYRTFFMILENQLPYLHFWDLPIRVKSIYEPFSGIFYIILHTMLWISADMFLLRWVAGLHLIVSVFIYLLLKKYNKTTAIIWVLLYLTSIIQYQVFWRGYIKQMMWIIFLISSFYLIEKKSYLLLIPILTGLFTVNRAGGIFFLVSFLIYKIISGIKKSWTWKDVYVVIIAGLLALIIYYPLLEEQIFSMFLPLFGQVFVGEQSGTFFDKSKYFVYNIIIIGFSLFGFILSLSKNIFKKYPMEFIGFGIGILWVGLQLFFYNRMLWYLDIFVIMIASYGLGQLIFSWKKMWKSIAILLYSLQLCVFIFYSYRTNFPLIVQKEFESIKEIPSIIPTDAKIMVTDKKYSAFLMWYAGYNIIARWLFDLDPWTTKQREYWHLVDGHEKCILLSELWNEQRPDYLWIGSLQNPTSLSWADCLDQKLWDTTYWFYLVNYPDAQ